METHVYQKIVEFINDSQQICRQETFDRLKLKFENDAHLRSPIQQLSYETFTSIYGNIKRRYMFKTNFWRKLKENELNFCNKYREYEQQMQNFKSSGEGPHSNNIILNMAMELHLSPSLMARLIIEGFLRTGALEIKDVAKEVQHKVSISSLMKESHLILNERLASEVLECCIIDDDYGPCIDSIKNVIGLEYEMKLEEILIRNQMCYVREEEMREKGFDKTPDFKLEVPIWVNGRNISWIDSKASFGDELSHSENYESQFKSYLNRFGSGLVIYWFGFMADIEKIHPNKDSLRSIVISDHFPEDFKSLDIDALMNDS